ncbi:unnamed protein product [Ostreobium quekettii]|uniref:Uncharacterized protein n=1 Tax=Ostreobium quekettii TaxID=121088 RepID=A0A8S1IUW0_9CHLO|nr:unnamed protein product [Ostreobium quekettii]|eukprot:evm.model.scf_113.8 EVM.evm.TU.scf_113.8   scf_113:132693-136449(-)
MSLTLSNAFAALEVRKAKKKKARESERKKKGGRGAAGGQDSLQLEREIFSRPQLNVSNWADCDDDEDDFDAGVGPEAAEDPSTGHKDANQEDGHDSEEEIDLEKEFGVELGPEGEAEADAEAENLTENGEDDAGEDGEAQEQEPLPTYNRSESNLGRQLSKKELKKKEMAELEAMLAEMGIAPDESSKKEGDGEGSSGLRKKKSTKKKLSISEPATGDTATTVAAQDAKAGEKENGSASVQAPTAKEDSDAAKVLKSKKKSQKKLPSATELAAAEAKARMKKKGKKDTKHYNQVMLAVCGSHNASCNT